MNDKECFALIDKGISRFNADKGFRIDHDPHSGWLVFEVRRIKWIIDSVNYDVSIYPSFNANETISSWNVSATVWYDKDGYRYHLWKQLFSSSTLLDISNNIDTLLSDAYTYISALRKYDIPKAVELSNYTN